MQEEKVEKVKGKKLQRDERKMRGRGRGKREK